MKRIVLISVIIAAVLPASIYAQLTNPRFVELPNTPVPVPTERFVIFGPAGANLVTQEGVDFATVGSLMPYVVTPPIEEDDMPQGDNTNFRIEYLWQFSPQMTPPGPSALNVLRLPLAATELPNPAAAPPSVIAPTANWFLTNEVSVRMPAQTGEVRLTHNARYIFNEQPMCPGDPNDNLNYTINVVPRPSIRVRPGVSSRDLETISCIDEDVIIPTGETGHLLLDGYEDLNIQFTMRRRPMASTNFTTIVADQWLVLEGKTLEFPGELFNEPGVYVIEFLNITDRISRKSLDMAAVAAQAGLDLPASTYTVYIYPRPSTEVLQPVRHLMNN